MFQPCPNCGFLVARVAPRRSGTEQRCPRCGQVLPPEDGTPAEAGTPEATPALHRRDAGAESSRMPQDAPGAPVGRASHRREPATRAAPGAVHRLHAASGPGSDARSAAGREADATASAAATTVIVHAQPTPPPAAHVHTAPPTVRAMPSFVRTPGRAEAPSRRWPLHAGIVALALALALQLVLAQRETLAAQARWRPVVEALCGALGCRVPAWREPSAFTMLDRSVLPKPGSGGVLTARASFRNDARWPQPWPTLVLTLSDVDGVPLGQRAFAPAEYAGDGGRLLMPGQAASVQLDVVEPAPGVVAFAFDFR